MAKATLNGWTKWIMIALALVLAIAGWVWNASAINSKVNVVCKENLVDHPKIHKNHDDIVKLQADVTYIKEGVDEIKQELKAR